MNSTPSPFDTRWTNFHPVKIGKTWGVIGHDGMDYRVLCDNLTRDGSIFLVNALLHKYAPEAIHPDRHTVT